MQATSKWKIVILTFPIVKGKQRTLRLEKQFEGDKIFSLYRPDIVRHGWRQAEDEDQSAAHPPYWRPPLTSREMITLRTTTHTLDLHSQPLPYPLLNIPFTHVTYVTSRLICFSRHIYIYSCSPEFAYLRYCIISIVS